MRDENILPELKPDEKLKKRLKDRDAKEIAILSGSVTTKTPSELKSKRLKRKLNQEKP